MTTESQLQANRQNALKSTGPKSIEGKHIASHNSVKHGLLSKDLIIGEENAEELQQFSDAIYQALCPQGAMEDLMVEKIVNAAWRLRRLTKAEGEFLGDSGFSYSSVNLSQAFRGLTGESIQRLARYESSLERIFYKAIHELQRVQAMRCGQPVLPAIAINLHGTDGEEIGFVS